MSEELQTYEAQPIDIIRQPQEVLADAQKAAKALAEVVRNKKKPVIMNGEQYLEFEDWQTVAKFYGVTAKVISTEYISFGEVHGFEAKAVAINRYGMEISGAEAMCLNDEPNWKSKPLFQLRSMAQTRACSKSLRNVLAWVVVLAGYKPTPAEEMTGQEQNGKTQPDKNKTTEPQRKVVAAPPELREKLNKELSEYCRFEDSEEVDEAMYESVLKEISKFDSNTKGEVFIVNVFDQKSPQGQTISDKWINACIGKLREKTGKKDADKPE